MTSLRPVYDAIHRKLTGLLRPSVLTISNESHKHAGHLGNPTGAADAETHFNVVVVSDAFDGLPAVARHRLIYQALQEELAAGLHALSLTTKTPSEHGRA